MAYHRFVSSVVGETVFEHHRNNELSLYILVNKQYVEDIPQFTQKITDYVSEAMNNH
jgi:predicted ester cyclase